MRRCIYLTRKANQLFKSSKWTEQLEVTLTMTKDLGFSTAYTICTRRKVATFGERGEGGGREKRRGGVIRNECPMLMYNCETFRELLRISYTRVKFWETGFGEKHGSKYRRCGCSIIISTVTSYILETNYNSLSRPQLRSRSDYVIAACKIVSIFASLRGSLSRPLILLSYF